MIKDIKKKKKIKKLKCIMKHLRVDTWQLLMESS